MRKPAKVENDSFAIGEADFRHVWLIALLGQNGHLSSDFWLGQELLTVMARVFISYSRKDKEGDALAAEQREAWVDWMDIPLTAEWQQEIFVNIEAAENFLFLISPDSAVSTNCRKEIDHAALNNKQMVPIYYRSVPSGTIPEALNRFQRLDFAAEDDFDSKLAVLIAALDSDLGWVQNVHAPADVSQRVGTRRKAQQPPPSRQRSAQYIIASHQSTSVSKVSRFHLQRGEHS